MLPSEMDLGGMETGLKVVAVLAAIGLVTVLYALISVTGAGLLGAGIAVICYGVYLGLRQS